MPAPMTKNIKKIMVNSFTIKIPITKIRNISLNKFDDFYIFKEGKFFFK